MTVAAMTVARRQRGRGYCNDMVEVAADLSAFLLSILFAFDARLSKLLVDQACHTQTVL